MGRCRDYPQGVGCKCNRNRRYENSRKDIVRHLSKGKRYNGNGYIRTVYGSTQNS